MTAQLKLVVQSLYYPAVLGSALVLFMQKLAQAVDFRIVFDGSVFFAIGLIIYFTISYLANESVNTYTVYTFSIEIIEIVLIFLSFYFLGFIDLNYQNMQAFYYCFALIPLVHLMWNWSIGFNDRKLVIKGIIASGILVFGAVAGVAIPYFNLIASGLLYIILFSYLYWLTHDNA